MKKEVVPIEEAIELKEMGFDKPTEAYYFDETLPYCNKGLNFTKNGKKINHNKFEQYIYSAPTVRQANLFRNSYKSKNDENKSSVGLV